jgi:preprotein translocase subunit SecA
MLNKVLKKVFGSKNERDIKRLSPIIASVNAFDDKMKACADEEFRELAAGFRKELANGRALDSLVPEAFAAVREVASRTVRMRHFDVQLIGGVVLHEGKIAEMKTGEGKTLVATLALYVNALSGKGAHLVTVNDYLARRDAVWMGPIYHMLGLTLGVIQHEESFIYDPEFMETEKGYYHLRPISRKDAYRADITYGTNNEFGFDYLRDNMKFSLDEYVQREMNFAIVDEVDSILIDEARTPLIISGPTEDSTDKYYAIDRVIPKLVKEEHYTVDEKAKQVLLTDEGVEKIEALLKVDNLYDSKNLELLHHVNQALRAHALFHIDVDYVVKDGAVLIVDEFTGRLMTGRRWSDGLHQAVEAKENVNIENENQTLATITFQNYFRMYDKLAGMTGTADTEAAEFSSIYNLEVIVAPTNVPLKRTDYGDLVYKTKEEKFDAVVEEIKDWLGKGRPVLVGTISIDDSEKLSSLLKSHSIPHNVLNAKQHQREAEIISQAGRLKAITLSTNMAGRGTDILLGGNPEFLAASKTGRDETTDAYKEALKAALELCEEEKKKVIEMGGLHIIGTERHESRRIDNQLRGRAGRQGDPGSSRFYLSLEDDLMRIFGSDRIAYIMDKIGMEKGVPIEHGLVTKAIENSQKKVEGHNFDIRKHLLEYDDVMNQQREVVYGYRTQILGQTALREMVKEFSEELVSEVVNFYVEEKAHPEDWDTKALNDAVDKQFGLRLRAEDLKLAGNNDLLIAVIAERSWKAYNEKITLIGDDTFSEFEKVIMLHTLDGLWKDHLLSMDYLKGGIGLRGYGQKDPLQEYKKEGYDIFVDMIHRLKSDVVERLFKVQIKSDDDAEEIVPEPRAEKVTLSRGEEPKEKETQGKKEKPVIRHGAKVGRNDPCPCGSGKKYKKCCGMKA